MTPLVIRSSRARASRPKFENDNLWVVPRSTTQHQTTCMRALCTVQILGRCTFVSVLHSVSLQDPNSGPPSQITVAAAAAGYTYSLCFPSPLIIIMCSATVNIY